MYYIKRKPKKKPLFEKEPVRKIPKTPSRQALIKKLDKIFSMYIRLRDSKKYNYRYFRCISCGQVKPFEQADAGHYMSRTHVGTRFNEMNVNAECRGCNRFSADHLVDYRRNLVGMYGEQKVTVLEYTAKQSCKLDAFELEQMIKYYSALVKRMEAEKRLTGLQ